MSNHVSERASGRRSSFDRLLSLSEWISATLVGLVCVGVTAAVLARYLFNAPLTGVHEFSGYALLAVTFLMAGALARDEGHIRVELAGELLPTTVVRWLDLTAHLLAFLLALLLTAGGTWIVWTSFTVGNLTPDLLQLSRWIILIPIPVGSALLALQEARWVRRYITNPHIGDARALEGDE